MARTANFSEGSTLLLAEWILKLNVNPRLNLTVFEY